MSINNLPDWASNLEEEDWGFIKNFILSSGSLKEVASHYDVSYPTVRLRLDKLIQKVKLNDDISNEPYISLIKKLAINDKIDIDTTKLLISEYKKTMRGEK
ncbi:DUF2089 family protein [Bacillaceae bacterium S4-13-58]